MYDWAKDAADSYTAAIEAMRAAFLAEKKPGETAKEWLARTGRETEIRRGQPRQEVETVRKDWK